MTTETNFKCVVYYIISLLYKISLTFSLRGFFRFSNNFLHISLMCLTFFFYYYYFEIFGTYHKHTIKNLDISHIDTTFKMKWKQKLPQIRLLLHWASCPLKKKLLH